MSASSNSAKGKSSFARLFLASIDPISCDADKAKEYFIEQGLNPLSIREEGIKRMRKLQLQLKAAQTRKDMAAADAAKQHATEWVEKLLSDISFSFPQFVRDEKLVLQNRNLDTLTPDDIKNTLIQYFCLKFLDQADKQQNGE